MIQILSNPKIFRSCTTSVKMVSTSNLHNMIYLEKLGGQIHYFDSGDVVEQSANVNYYPPLIILGGTAQTISSFGLHISSLSRNRRIIIPEMRCQGLHTSLNIESATISQHVHDFHEFISVLGLKIFDLCGFSFGGRLSLAYASHYPAAVRKITVTGVPLVRNPLGVLIMHSWLDLLMKDDLKSAALSFVLNGYSDVYIDKIGTRLFQLVNIIDESNSSERLYHLIKLSQDDHEDNINYTTQNVIKNINCPVQIIAGNKDRICSYEAACKLFEVLNDKDRRRLVTLPTGHLVPFEDPILWRKAVLDFLC
eukprot:gene4773-6695_t